MLNVHMHTATMSGLEPLTVLQCPQLFVVCSHDSVVDDDYVMIMLLRVNANVAAGSMLMLLRGQC